MSEYNDGISLQKPAQFFYSDRVLSLALNGYWNLVDQEMPPELASAIAGMGERAPFETPAVLRADIDLAMDMLSPGRWKKFCDGLDQGDFYADSRRVYKLCLLQQGIVRYHWLGQLGEVDVAAKARRLMRKFLNGR
jgi:hypothetical protein